MEIAVDFLFLVKVRFVSGAQNAFAKAENRTRQTSGFFMPADFYVRACEEYKTRKGNYSADFGRF